MELSGDVWRHKTFPKIRLQGKWLEQLGERAASRPQFSASRRKQFPTIEATLLRITGCVISRRDANRSDRDGRAPHSGIVPTIEGELLLKFIAEEAGTSSQLNDQP